jgi:hypothetical protein
MPYCFATTFENPVVQAELSAVCGFSSPNWPKAADLPEKREVCATRLHDDPILIGVRWLLTASF